MKKYSFLNTVVLVNGVEITGWAEGDDVIQIDRRNDSISDVVGADGEMTIAISADRSGTMTFNLQQSSTSNAFLSALVAAGENGAFVPVSLLFKDLNGNDLAAGTKGYFTKPAPITRGTGVNGQEWVCVVENLQSLLGGSPSI
jgi:hypothetical protein